jgi:hypothetical protein
MNTHQREELVQSIRDDIDTAVERVDGEIDTHYGWLNDKIENIYTLVEDLRDNWDTSVEEIRGSLPCEAGRHELAESLVAQATISDEEETMLIRALDEADGKAFDQDYVAAYAILRMKVREVLSMGTIWSTEELV